MSRTGQQYVDGLRDGRGVYIDGERVSDVTTHPAFRDAVRSVADLYDLSADDAARDLVTYASPTSGEPVNVSWMIPRSVEDLTRRRKGLRAQSEASLGLMGRTPEHVAGFFAGFAGNAELFAQGGKEFAENLVNFYEWARDNDQYITYVIAPPQIDRSKPAHQQADPTLYAGVKEERDGGIVVAGAQMLGTGAALSDWVLLSNIVPLGPGDENYAISVVIPIGAEGVRVHSRRSYASGATSHFDYPLSTRFDETDSLLVFDDVFVPWEHVFVYRNLELARDQWWKTPAHVLGNNQAQIRFSTKLDFLLGVMRAVADMNGTVKAPPVQGVLGEAAAYATMVHGMVAAQEANAHIDEHGVAWPGVAEVHALSTLAIDFYPKLVQMARELCGGGVIQLPSSRDDFGNPEIAADIERFIQSPGVPAQDRVRLMKLAWDLLGSEFASRHHQYELFYAGAPHLVRGRMFRHFDFERGAGLVERGLSGYDLEGRTDAATDARG